MSLHVKAGHDTRPIDVESIVHRIRESSDEGATSAAIHLGIQLRMSGDSLQNDCDCAEKLVAESWRSLLVPDEGVV